jgi:Second Messenger Oligonucleotide or Dinucleotide Synthetase domain
MAFLVDTAFTQFHNKINLSGDHRADANRRKDWVVSRLNTHFTILDAFSFGSIPKFTALREHADADVMVVLHWSKHIKDRQPATVLLNVKNALGTTAASVRRNGQAVSLKFNTWPAVDIVPAARFKDSAGVTTHYEIPDMNRGIWLPTYPRKHASQIQNFAGTHGANFRQVIKMVKHWNRRQAVPLQSYHIEVIALQMTTSWNDIPWAIFKWFEAASQAVRFCWHDGANVGGYLTHDQSTKAEARLREVTSIARPAWSATYRRADHQTAIRLWKSIFGSEFPAYG